MIETDNKQQQRPIMIHRPACFAAGKNVNTENNFTQDFTWEYNIGNDIFKLKTAGIMSSLFWASSNFQGLSAASKVGKVGPA